LIFIECANVLWKKMRRGEVEPADADGDLEDLAELRLTVTPTARLMRAALHLAWTYRISAYDACYVALARELGVPLLTADERLASALKECTVEVLRLTECLRGE
jgi:predicted nucleic acid-binding protein